VVWAVLAVLALAVAVLLLHRSRDDGRRTFDPTAYPRRLAVEDGNLTLVPESERPLDRIVVGINQASGHYYLLPVISRWKGVDRRRLETVRRMLYLSDLETCHGFLWGVLPPETRVFVGVPVTEEGKTSPVERRWFKQYLVERWGWSRDRVAEKVRFFDMPTFAPWTQDMGEVVGWDRRGRTVLVVGDQEPDYYRQSVMNLVRSYPREFDVRPVPSAVSTEGGDIEMSWGPDGGPQLVAGRHAAVRYIGRMAGVPAGRRPVSLPQVLDSRQAYSSAFFGIPELFLPKSVLMDPGQGDPELFHLDMIATFFAGRERSLAAVPYYLEPPVDAVSGREMDPAFVRRLRGEYNRAALELQAAGYDVVRLPFQDHPVRGPVNLVKYYDRKADRQVVYLAKYPRHVPVDGQPTDQLRILWAVYEVQNRGAAWQANPGEAEYTEFIRSMGSLYSAMNMAAVAPDPVFEAQRAALEAVGCRVVPVPMFAWGAGGLHCQILH
jgi:hypothetical protein